MNELQNAGKTTTLSINQNIAGLLCYVPVAFVNVAFSVLWLTTEPEQNRALRFHAMQGLCLAGGALAVGMAIWTLALVLVPLGGWQLISGLYSLDSLVFVVASIIGMLHAYAGIEYKLPYIGEFAEKQINR